MNAAARERLLEAMLIELGESGREGIVLPELLKRCAVSAADFAASYSHVDECLTDAFGEVCGQLTTATLRGCRKAGSRSGGGSGWPAHVWGGLSALLAELSSKPQLARALVGAFPSMGLIQRARYQTFVEGFVPLLEHGREFSGAERDLPAEVEMLAIGAAEAIIFEEVASGRAAELPAMGPSILFSLLVPFLGPKAAATAMERARRAP